MPSAKNINSTTEIELLLYQKQLENNIQLEQTTAHELKAVPILEKKSISMFAQSSQDKATQTDCIHNNDIDYIRINRIENIHNQMKDLEKTEIKNNLAFNTWRRFYASASPDYITAYPTYWFDTLIIKKIESYMPEIQKKVIEVYKLIDRHNQDIRKNSDLYLRSSIEKGKSQEKAIKEAVYEQVQRANRIGAAIFGL